MDTESFAEARRRRLCEALEKASATKPNKINVAISNPCFEYWILLHYEHCASRFRDCNKVITRLRKHDPGYKKRPLDFDSMKERLKDAVQNATRVLTNQWRGKRDPLQLIECNPCTRVHCLVQAIEKVVSQGHP